MKVKLTEKTRKVENDNMKQACFRVGFIGYPFISSYLQT